MIDFFVAHDWRDSDQRNVVLRYLDDVYGLDWRNFGNVWYDPRIKISSSDGLAYLQNEMTSQILPAEVVLLVPIAKKNSEREKLWRAFAIEIASKYHKPICDFDQITYENELNIRKINYDFYNNKDRFIAFISQILIR